jgi:hypothetical protein
MFNMAHQSPVSLTHRIIVMSTILILLLLSCTYFYFWGKANHPSTEYITSHPDDFNNETLTFGGDIKRISKPVPDLNNGSKTWIITIESDEIELDLIVEDSKLNIEPKKGDHVTCKGVYLQNNIVNVTEIHIADRTLVNLIFIRSVAVIPLLIILLIVNWKFNIKKLLFEIKR